MSWASSSVLWVRTRAGDLPSPTQGAAIWMQYVTAWGALVHYGKVATGDVVLTTAASSSVGLAAIQIVKDAGAVAIAATRTSRKREELLAVGARPRRAALTGPEALTAAEHQVATLAASGRSNRQIAQQLFITQATVETHLRHSFHKLGITSRADLLARLGGADGTD